jgi:GNAT superfamily N-acetyltransferase
MSDIQIRPLRPGDGNDLAQAWLDAGVFYARQNPEYFQVPAIEGLAEWLDAALTAASDDHLSIVAECDAKAVGFLVARVRPPMKHAANHYVRESTQTCLIIDGLGVEKRCWRRGIATRLMDAAEVWGRERGATVALLDTYADSPLSVPFYEEHLGYARRSVRFRKALSRSSEVE